GGGGAGIGESGQQQPPAATTPPPPLNGSSCCWPLAAEELQQLTQCFTAMPALQVLELRGLSGAQVDEVYAALLGRPTLNTKASGGGWVEWISPDTPRISFANWRGLHRCD
ncbi:hypothetical protein Agub_g10553, partial [Astrephomene gubernaculifera]